MHDLLELKMRAGYRCWPVRDRARLMATRLPDAEILFDVQREAQQNQGHGHMRQAHTHMSFLYTQQDMHSTSMREGCSVLQQPSEDRWPSTSCV